jgi:hypothetical protein
MEEIAERPLEATVRSCTASHREAAISHNRHTALYTHREEKRCRRAE